MIRYKTQESRINSDRYTRILVVDALEQHRRAKKADKPKYERWCYKWASMFHDDERKERVNTWLNRQFGRAV